VLVLCNECRDVGEFRHEPLQDSTLSSGKVHKALSPGERVGSIVGCLSTRCSVELRAKTWLYQNRHTRLVADFQSSFKWSRLAKEHARAGSQLRSDGSLYYGSESFGGGPEKMRRVVVVKRCVGAAEELALQGQQGRPAFATARDGGQFQGSRQARIALLRSHAVQRRYRAAIGAIEGAQDEAINLNKPCAHSCRRHAHKRCLSMCPCILGVVGQGHGSSPTSMAAVVISRCIMARPAGPKAVEDGSPQRGLKR
jgi:hypothetical protein